jgi:hypothetical protein
VEREPRRGLFPDPGQTRETLDESFDRAGQVVRT